MSYKIILLHSATDDETSALLNSAKWVIWDIVKSTIMRWHYNGMTINVSLRIFIYKRICVISVARFASYARSVLAMDAENMQLYEATVASAARNKIYESLRFLKNWRQRSILLAKCNIEVLKSARDDNVTSLLWEQRQNRRWCCDWRKLLKLSKVCAKSNLR